MKAYSVMAVRVGDSPAWTLPEVQAETVSEALDAAIFHAVLLDWGPDACDVRVAAQGDIPSDYETTVVHLSSVSTRLAPHAAPRERHPFRYLYGWLQIIYRWFLHPLW